MHDEMYFLDYFFLKKAKYNADTPHTTAKNEHKNVLSHESTGYMRLKSNAFQAENALEISMQNIDKTCAARCMRVCGAENL